MLEGKETVSNIQPSPVASSSPLFTVGDNKGAQLEYSSQKKKTPRKYFALWFLVASVVFGLVVFVLNSGVKDLGAKPLSPLGSGANQKTELEGSTSTSDSSVKGTIENPLNGLLYTEEQSLIWKSRRPMAVMVNNHADARSFHSGLSAADIVYEANAEGGIPRLMPVFLSKLPEKVGSVRSVRVYFVDFAKEVDAWLAHWGGAQIDPNDASVTDPAADAFSRMRDIYVSSLDEMRIGEGKVFWRDIKNGLSLEHTGYVSVPSLVEVAYKLYPDQPRAFRPNKNEWVFKDDLEASDRPEGFSAAFNFWDIVGYDVRWEYQKSENNYVRFQGGKEHKDVLSGKQLTAKTIIIQYMDESSFNDKKNHLKYKTLGSGRAQILQDGKITEAIWRRVLPEERTQYFIKSSGVEVSFNRGPIWIEILPEGNTVTVNQ